MPNFYVMAYKEDTLPISMWAEADRPREKLNLLGKHALSNSELLAIVIGSGTSTESALDLARRLLKQHHNDLGELARLGVNDLIRFKGIGPVKAVGIIASFELGRRHQLSRPRQKTIIKTSQDAFDVLNNYLSDQLHEEFWILFLNRANAILTCERISVGGTSATVVDAKIVFQKALQHRANSLILSHNHPSGQMKASEQDVRLTKKLKQAGALLDIKVLDHLIISGNRYLSMGDEGLF